MPSPAKVDASVLLQAVHLLLSSDQALAHRTSRRNAPDPHQHTDKYIPLTRDNTFQIDQFPFLKSILKPDAVPKKEYQVKATEPNT